MTQTVQEGNGYSYGKISFYIDEPVPCSEFSHRTSKLDMLPLSTLKII